MKYVSLTQGKRAIIDDEDYEYINKFNWYFSNGYARRSKRINNKMIKIRMHRFILGLGTISENNIEVDHINGNKLDNRKYNLRICTHKDNIRNSNISKNNKTGYNGVYWNKRLKKYISKIVVNYKTIHLGIFSNKINAAHAYNLAATKYFGQYARLNDV